MELLTTELLTTAEMAQADRLTIAGGIAGTELMENAGRAVADHVSSRHPPGTRVAVVAGPGNNGGDGLVAGRLLRERGYRVRMLLVGDIGRWRGDAREAAQRWSGPYEPATAHSLMPDEVVIDALFGAGLDRPVEGSPRAMIEAMNKASCVHAIDLPSGINGTTGAVMGTAVRASTTVTFFRRKLGRCCRAGCIAERSTSRRLGLPGLSWRGSRRRPGSTRLRFGATAFPCRNRRGTNTLAGIASSRRADCSRPVPRGLPRVERCAWGPGWLPLRARGMHSPSMPRRTLP